MPKQATLSQKALVELIATFMFVFVGAGSVIASQFVPWNSALLVIALGNGIGLAIAISFAMGISGGHVNPAVTIAALVARKINLGDACVYIVSQLVGAVIAGVFLIALYPSSIGAAVHYGAPSLSSSTSVLNGTIFEALMTFFLVSVVFGTVVDGRAPKLGGFAVGAVVVVDVLAGGAFTGAAMNPARALGPMIASGFFANWFVYIIGPVIGAVAAAIIYGYLLLEKTK